MGEGGQSRNYTKPLRRRGHNWPFRCLDLICLQDPCGLKRDPYFTWVEGGGVERGKEKWWRRRGGEEVEARLYKVSNGRTEHIFATLTIGRGSCQCSDSSAYSALHKIYDLIVWMCSSLYIQTQTQTQTQKQTHIHSQKHKRAPAICNWILHIHAPGCEVHVHLQEIWR